MWLLIIIRIVIKLSSIRVWESMSKEDQSLLFLNENEIMMIYWVIYNTWDSKAKEKGNYLVGFENSLIGNNSLVKASEDYYAKNSLDFVIPCAFEVILNVEESIMLLQLSTLGNLAVDFLIGSS